MRRVLWVGAAVFSLACGETPITVIADLDPVDATNALQVFVTNDTGGVTVVGEPGRTNVDVEVTFNGGVQADYDQVLALSVLEGTSVSVSLDVPSQLPNVVGDLKILVPDTFGANITGNTSLVSVSSLSDGAIINADAGEITLQDVTGGITANSNACNVVIDTSMNAGDTITVNTEVLGNIQLTLPANTDADFIAASGSGQLAIGAGFNFAGTNTNGVADGTFNAGGNGATQIDLFTQSGEITLLTQ